MSVTFLQINSKIILHTRAAQSMFNYTWRFGKMGLLQFAKLTSTIWKAANQDDPYADWILYKTYQALLDATEKIKALEVQFSQQLSEIRGIETTPVLNASPVTYPLQFGTFFGFKGAALLADADYVLRQILTLKRLGRHPQDDAASIHHVIKYLQDVFAVPRQWHHTGLKRSHFKDNSQNVQNAIAIMGKVPDFILQKKIDFYSL